jgi:acetolactate synthase-1/3 small subunit
MLQQTSERSSRAAAARHTVLELTVRNHPGVMSHICGLFARRAYNLEGILCMPFGDGQQSRIWLLVDDDARLEQVMKQTAKLHDVLDVRRHGADRQAFMRLEQFFHDETEARKDGGNGQPTNDE